VRLRYHSIVGGRYYLAGEEIPDAPPSFAKYAVSEGDGDATERREPVKQKPRRYTVSRGRMFKKAK
jgi:hypothetical protein